MKRYLLVFLAVALALGSLSASYLSVAAEDEGEYTYVIQDGKAVITHYNGEGGFVTVPSMLGGAPVTEIAEGAFLNAFDLTALRLPEGLTVIASNAFYNCQHLKSIFLPESLRRIGWRAFAWCTDLESITIPKSVNSIEEGAFTGCFSLKSIAVEEGNAAYALRQGCLIALESGLLLRGAVAGALRIPEGVQEIGDGAFSGCTGLQRVTIPEGVTRIGADAFNYCDGLTDVILPDSVETIQDRAFSGCTALRTVYLPAGVTSMGNYAFTGCKGLAHIYCAAEEPPVDRHYEWLGDCKASVHWGYIPTSGDLDGDGVISATDYLLLKRHVIGTFTLNAAQLSVADVDKDGTVNALDYLLVKRHVLGSYVIG